MLIRHTEPAIHWQCLGERNRTVPMSGQILGSHPGHASEQFPETRDLFDQIELNADTVHAHVLRAYTLID